MKVRLLPGDGAILEARLRAGRTGQRQLLRIRIVLEAAGGHAAREIARELETPPATVSLWRFRCALEGLDGLEDRLRSGTPPICGEAADQPPPKGFVRWNGRLIARALGNADVPYVWRLRHSATLKSFPNLLRPVAGCGDLRIVGRNQAPGNVFPATKHACSPGRR